MKTWWGLILVKAICDIIPLLIIFMKDGIVFSSKITLFWNGVKMVGIVDLKEFTLSSHILFMHYYAY